MGHLIAGEICSLDELESLAPSWQQLYERCRIATPFQSPAWLLGWWRAFAPGELRVFAVYEERELIALAPMYLEGERLLPVGVGISDYLDVLIDPARFDQAAAQLANCMFTSEDWRICELPELHHTASAWALPAPAHAAEEQALGNVCPVLPLPGAGCLLNAVVPKHRMEAVRNTWNRARRLGEAGIVQAGVQTLDHWLDVIDRLHAQRRDSRTAMGLELDQRVRRFLRQSIPPLMSRGEAAIYGFQLGGECLGALLVLNTQHSALCYMTGFDRAAQRLSPGSLLFAHAIEQALVQGKRELDFLRGEESYKFLWGARPYRNGARRIRRTLAARFAARA